MIKHVVSLRLKDSADVPGAVTRLRSLSSAGISGLLGIEVGQNVNTVDPGSFDIALMTEHGSLEELHAYAVHPAHQEVLSWLRPRIADRAVVDYRAD